MYLSIGVENFKAGSSAMIPEDETANAQTVHHVETKVFQGFILLVRSFFGRIESGVKRFESAGRECDISFGEVKFETKRLGFLEAGARLGLLFRQFEGGQFGGRVSDVCRQIGLRWRVETSVEQVRCVSEHACHFLGFSWLN